MKLGAGEEQAEAKLLDLRIPCLRVQHPSAEVENDLFNTCNIPVLLNPN
jgi:hypothetical protein